eukprot:gene11197-4017_t
MSNEEPNLTTRKTTIIKLNVGGKKYMTTAETLTSKGKNFFSGIVESKIPIESDENGYIFIDRSPNYFDIILIFLRTGSIPTCLDKTVSIPDLNSEIEFYCVNMPKLKRVHLEFSYKNLGSYGSGGFYSNEYLSQEILNFVTGKYPTWKVPLTKVLDALIEDGWNIETTDYKKTDLEYQILMSKIVPVTKKFQQ